MSELQQPDSRNDAEFGPMHTISVPSTFQGWCSLISDVLSPAEELSPFKLGQIKELITEFSKDLGLFVAPAFVLGQVLFLVAFVGYLVTAIYSLIANVGALSDACANESWVWLFVLLAVAIPSGLGLILGLVKTGLRMASVKVPSPLFSFPGPICYITFFVLSILLWAYMSPACDAVYSKQYSLLYLIFKVQIFIFGIASIFGALTTFAQTMALIQQFDTEPDMPALRQSFNEGIGSSTTTRKAYVEESQSLIDRLKAQLETTKRERDEAEQQRDAARRERGTYFEFPQSFGEFSSLIVHHLAPVEELSPFKLVFAGPFNYFEL